MRRSRKIGRFAVHLLGLLLCTVMASCKAVGPDYKRPAMNDMPDQYKSSTAVEAPPPLLQPDWWRLFNDPTLNQLEESALSANSDLRAAMARVIEAQAAARATFSQFYPQISLSPSFSESQVSANSPSARSSANAAAAAGRRINTQPNVNGDFQLPVNLLSYEIDVWGRVRRLYEASQAAARASASDFQVVLQTLEAEVAIDYFSIRALDAQERILSQTVESFVRQVELTQTQLRAGLVGRIDVVQAQAQLNSTIAQEIDVRRQRADLEHALAVLLGRVPSDLSIRVQPLEMPVPAIPVGLPGELLRRRPDVATAEQNLIAANAQVGVAVAAFYPTIHLTGSAGFESTDLNHLFDWPSRFFGFGPGINWPIFTGGLLEANLAQAKARYEELAANYRSSILAAIRDVEDSLTDLHLRSEEASAQELAVQASREYVRLATVQYQRGLTNYLLVIDAERTQLQNELSAVQVLNQRLASTVQLIKSLGGGWDSQTAPSTQILPSTRPATTLPAAHPMTQPAATTRMATTQPGRRGA